MVTEDVRAIPLCHFMICRILRRPIAAVECTSPSNAVVVHMACLRVRRHFRLQHVMISPLSPNNRRHTAADGSTAAIENLQAFGMSK